MTAQALEIGIDHHANQTREIDVGPPPERLPGLRGVADQVIDFGGPQELRDPVSHSGCQSRPTWPNATSTRSRTEWLTPVAMT